MPQERPHPGKIDVTPLAKAFFNEMIDARQTEGIRKYGVSLQTFNGRNPYQDTHEELVDAFQYIKQAELEHDELRKECMDAFSTLEAKNKIVLDYATEIEVLKRENKKLREMICRREDHQIRDFKHEIDELENVISNLKRELEDQKEEEALKNKALESIIRRYKC